MKLSPSWLKAPRDRHLWQLIGVLAILAAASESGIGLWLKNLSPSIGPGWFALLCGLLALRLLFSALRDYAGECLSLRAAAALHQSRWNSGIPLSPTDLQIAEQGTRAALQLRTGIVSLILILPAMAFVAPRLALWALLAALLLGIASRFRSEAMRKLSADDARDDESFGQRELWTARALPETAAAGNLADLARVSGHYARKRLTRRLDRALSWQFHQSALEAAAHLASLVLAAAAFLSWKHGTLSLGQLMAFLALALLAYRPVREAGRALPACLRARHLPSGEPPHHPPTGRALEFHDVSFRYADGGPVLQHLSFALPAHGIALLHGPNGCGKSTLLKLAAGHLRPVTGNLCVPEGPLRWIDQETVLPPFSLQHWLKMSAPPEDTPAAAFLKRHVFPALPGWRWDRAIEDGGSRLSRGQRLRLRLAVLICSPGSLWLLDEPLSSLPRSERGIILQDLLACRQDAAVLIADQELPDLPVQPLFQPGNGTGPAVHLVDL